MAFVLEGFCTGFGQGLMRVQGLGAQGLDTPTAEHLASCSTTKPNEKP